MVKRIFRKHFASDINEFLPLLICAQSKGNIDSVVGLRSAQKETLFLEQYLAAPIEQVLQLEHGLSIDRNNLLEIGNLVCNSFVFL